MKKLFLAAVLFISLGVASQQTWYVAIKSGMNMREKPDAKSTVIGKIPYGTKIVVTYDEIINITTEGIVGAWAKTTYNGKTGYIVNSYLFPSPPPKATVKTMKDYLASLAPVFGAKLTVKSGSIQTLEDGGWELRKQLYKNGGEYHEFVGYEYHSNTYFIPNFTVTQGFLLLRMIPEFNMVFGEKDELPNKSRTFKKGEIEYEVTVESEMIGDNPWIERIKIEFADGAIYTFEMYSIDNQLVVTLGSGV